MQGCFEFGFKYVSDKRVLTVISERPKRELRLLNH